jgi:hypothetical protein
MTVSSHFCICQSQA